LLLVEDGDGLRWWQRIELKGAGGDAKDARGEFEIPVSPEWQRHDLHISAQIAAPDSDSKPVSKRGAEPALGRSGAAHPGSGSAPSAAYPERT
jgi:hypothetical protein